MSEPSDPVSPTTSHHSAPIPLQSTPLQSTPVSFPSRAPRVHHLPILKADLKKVAASRGNVHARKVAILIRWENDNTGAQDDVVTMGKVMETFDIQYTEHILKAKDAFPGWNLQAEIRKMILDLCDSKLHSLFVFYYAGHGTIVDGNLFLPRAVNVLHGLISVETFSPNKMLCETSMSSWYLIVATLAPQQEQEHSPQE